MAQKTEKEETEFKVPESLTLCVNNCGVTGNPATNNMCQKCFNASTSTSTTSVVTAAPNSNTSTAATTTKSSDSLSGGVIFTFTSEKLPRSRSQVKDPSPDGKQKLQSTDRGERSEDPATAVKREVNRCSGCRRKVGLTGFRCRCGELFCWEHRYSDRHDCSYDYKAAGREAIARENPVVKAAKIVKV